LLEDEVMTVDYVVFAVCTLFVGILILILKRVRGIDTKLGKIREIDLGLIMESRDLLIKLNANPEAVTAEIAPDNATAESNGGEIVPLRKQSPPTVPRAA
jgi:hypothetical protein